MTLSLFTAAALLASFDCQLQAPRAVSFDGANATASEMGLPPAALAFSVAIEKGNPLTAKVDWPSDPMQIGGKFPAIETAPGAYAFSAFSGGPCLFTEQACLSQVNLVEHGNGTARVIIAPVALASDEVPGTRSPFAVIALGQCRRTDVKK